MFGFNKNNNNYKMPNQGHTTITPDNYGYSHTFIDDDSQMVLEWEQNGCLPTPELAAKAKQTATERTKQASLSKQIKRDLAKVSKANAEIVKNFGATKLTAAQSAKSNMVFMPLRLTVWINYRRIMTWLKFVEING